VKNYCYSHSYSYHNTYQEWQIDFAGDPLYLTEADGRVYKGCGSRMRDAIQPAAVYDGDS